MTFSSFVKKLVLLLLLESNLAASHFYFNSICSNFFGNLIDLNDSVGLRIDLNRLDLVINNFVKLPFVKHSILARTEEGLPIHAITVNSQPSSRPPSRVLLLAGVHGSEPLGVTASMQLIQSFVNNPILRENFEITIVVINPYALAQNTRRFPLRLTSAQVERVKRNMNREVLTQEADGRYQVDLNRIAFKEEWPAEYEQVRLWLQQKNFDIGLDLHGAAGKHDYFVIAASEEMVGMTTKILQKLQPTLPLLQSVSGEYPGYAGSRTKKDVYLMHQRGVATSQSEGTLKEWMYQRGMSYVATLEYPGQMDAVDAHYGLWRLSLALMWEARNSIRSGDS